jgi:hypothetical protein
MEPIEQATAAPGEKRNVLREAASWPFVITDGDSVVIEVPSGVKPHQIEALKAALEDELSCRVVVLVGVKVTAVRRG